MIQSPISWQGVFPAVTTQFRPDFSVDLEATSRVAAALVADGVDGLIAIGSVGENSALSADEKLAVAAAILEASGGLPVIAGLAEITTEAACTFARKIQAAGLQGLMVMPPMIYGASGYELSAWFRAIAAASDLPIMLYNNPPAYRNDLSPSLVATLTDVPTIVAIKESSGDTRRFTDLANAVGDRFLPFCGLDDVVLECLALGAVGWVSGLSNVFPRECAKLFAEAKAGRMDAALPLYRWLMPLLHLDARPDLVQCIKLCEAIMGRGGELTRPPRLTLPEAERAQVVTLMETALANRPAL